jgi:imidazolonepropionase-like amidohydrolase
MVIDGTGTPPHQTSILVEDGRIVSLDGPIGDAAVVDLTGKWLIPGLIDAHVHFFQSGSLYTRPDVVDLRHVVPYRSEIAALRARLDETLARTFAAGITAVLDLGGPPWVLELRHRADDLATAPRVVAVGPLLATWAPREISGGAITLIETPEQAVAEVRRQAAEGVEMVKVWFIRRGRGQTLEVARRWIAAAMDEAHRLGLRVAVHATQLETARIAVALGADLLVHSVDDAALDPALLESLGSRVPYIPTLGVYDAYWRVLGQSLGLNALDNRYGDPDVLATLDDLSTMRREQRPHWLSFGEPPPINPLMLDNLARAHAAGVTIAAGSDAGNIGTLPGAGFHRELALMADAGLDPLSILLAATRNAAKALGRSDIGTLEPGQRADVVVLDADPLSDIANAARIHRVIKDGIMHDPDAILAGLSNGE